MYFYIIYERNEYKTANKKIRHKKQPNAQDGKYSVRTAEKTVLEVTKNNLKKKKTFSNEQ